ncbi:hypothetical protein DYB28_006142 [Aphanomyces astaci]|uniref:GST N-terminal domain-containing protein n=3 Tax=Aphanomyces astaci TaxID=112090 RepID=A0A397F3S2_APHAT|nr:hypothetical protein DYB36_004262 [Aphanomyces astaci]RHZ14265.1 hypothetical protein DYB31_009292 [Aphanomyces astaci]RLO03166.1 hypothetical protein DYB28_006142 [Aphanomyces astaci]
MAASKSHSYRTINYATLTDDQIVAFTKPDGKLNYFNCVVCPFAQRVLWAALEVQAPIDTVVELDVFNLPPSYSRLVNRYGDIPHLIHDGTHVYDSPLTVNYLDATFGRGKLGRRDTPKIAALTDLLTLKTTHIPFYGYLSGRDKTDAPLRALLSELETIYRDHAKAHRANGPFLLGANVSTGDINLIPLLFRFEILFAHYKAYTLLPEKDFPLLKAALEAAKALPTFQQTVQDPSIYIQGYSVVANQAS